MRRNYTKPVMEVERFVPNVAVAAECTRLPAEKVYQSEQVDCVVTTYDIIFADPNVGCKHVVNINGSSTDYMFITYDSQLYFAWVGPSGGKDDDGDMNLLKAILAAGGITDVMVSRNKVWHAGPATAYLKQLYSHS